VTSEALSSLGLGGILITLGYSAGRKTTIDVTDLIWKQGRMAGFSVKPIVERVYAFGQAGEALRRLIEDRPFGKVVLAG
jgi:NADPH:quinone reductase-like Zn-dependent oxidoreductase